MNPFNLYMKQLENGNPIPSNPSKEEEMVVAIALKNLEEFKKLLDFETYINFQKLVKTKYCPLAAICCLRDPKYKEFAEVILNADFEVDLNKKFQNGEGYLHLAVKSGNHYVLEPILSSEEVDLNAQTEEGDAPLHYLAKLTPTDLEDDEDGDYTICMDILLSNENININCQNSDGYVPIHLAAYQVNNLFINKLLKREDLDLDHSWANNETPRECLLRTKWIEAVRLIPIKKMSPSIMFNLLKYRSDKFIELLPTVQTDLSKYADYIDPFSGMTLLQYAATNYKTDAACFMITHGFDPFDDPQMKGTPFEISLRNTNHEIIKKIVDSPVRPNSEILWIYSFPLHHLVRQRCDDSDKCLQHILPQRRSLFLNIYEMDAEENTPLHIAVSVGTDTSVLLILENGGFLGAINSEGVMPIESIESKVLEIFLDKQINTFVPNSDNDKALSINYSFLMDRSVEDYVEPKVDIRLLQKLSENESMRPLLKHVVLSSLILLKWNRMKNLFFANIIFVKIFCIVLTWYSITFSLSSRICLGLVNSILLIRETIQFFMNKKKYRKDYENYIEIAIIILTFFVIIFDYNEAICIDFLAITVLLSWLNFLLILGRHPYFSVKIEMFLIVLCTFITYLSVYIIMILAFGLSFYILFNKDTSEDNRFNGFFTSIFKTLVMSSGEFEGGDIPFDTSNHPYSSRIIFFFFVILVALVLVNLLNGLAVYDTKEIRDNALTYSFVTYLKYLTTIEETFENCGNWGKFGKYLFKEFIDFPSDPIDVVIQGKRIVYLVFNDYKHIATNDFLDEDIINATRVIIQNKINLIKSSDTETLNDAKDYLCFEKLSTDMKEKLEVLESKMNEKFGKIEGDSKELFRLQRESFEFIKDLSYLVKTIEKTQTKVLNEFESIRKAINDLNISKPE